MCWWVHMWWSGDVLICRCGDFQSLFSELSTRCCHWCAHCTGHLHICQVEAVHLHMWTIVDMLLCNATHITLHRTRVLYNMEEVKKSTRSITAIVIPQNTSPLQHGSSSKRNLCNQCNSCHQSTRGHPWGQRCRHPSLWAGLKMCRSCLTRKRI